MWNSLLIGSIKTLYMIFRHRYKKPETEVNFLCKSDFIFVMQCVPRDGQRGVQDCARKSVYVYVIIV